MIKKILATICAVGLIFASCFVGYKIDSKADQSIVPNDPTYDKYLKVVDGNYYTPYFDFTTISSTGNVISCTVCLLVTRGTQENASIITFGGGFCLYFSFATANNSNYTSNFIATYSTSFDPDYYTGSNPSTYFKWSSWNNTATFPSISSGVFHTSSLAYQDDWLTFRVNASADGRQRYSLSFHASNLTRYTCSLSNSSDWKKATSSYNFSDFFVSQTSLNGAIYTEDQYQNYGNQQYQQGQQAGYDKGYSAGLADGGGNSFLSLITAVVDAPIVAFTSLLNFEILGFNLKNVVLSILTAALVIACVRFFSGKFSGS